MNKQERIEYHITLYQQASKEEDKFSRARQKKAFLSAHKEKRQLMMLS